MARYRLTVKAGYYEADSLVGLALEVLRHRTWHFLRGEGWTD